MAMSTTRYKYGLLVFCSAIGAVAAFTAGRANSGSAVTDEYTGASLSYGEQTTQASAQRDVVPTTFSSSVDGARLLEVSATAIEADPQWGCMSSSIVCTTLHHKVCRCWQRESLHRLGQWGGERQDRGQCVQGCQEGVSAA